MPKPTIAIENEVELKRQQRIADRVEQMKKEGLKPDHIKQVLEDDKRDKDPKKDVVVCNCTADIQKRKIDRLMNNPTKPAYIPEPRKEWKLREPAEFVRHVMGSSAGAGSGEFHVYRGIRRRETKRTEFLEKKGLKEELDSQYHGKVEQNKMLADAATEKKRNKRQKKKQKILMAKKMKTISIEEGKESEEDKDEAEEDEEEQQHFVIGGK